ncbi:MAG: lipocalin family protein, partial [Gemmatimonadota bacterium]|nr:lipocalin family protein [Gemmatimonadota bacterium]
RRAGAQDTPQRPEPVHAIPSLDLERYAGRWYEVARFPSWFERKCVGQATADYELRPDGTIRVVNTCRTADSTVNRAEGAARLADRNGPPSRLKVRFAPSFLSFLPMVWADYWVLDLTDDYGAALVGTPDRRYLWVLSRTPALDSATYDRLVATAGRQGFDVARLQRLAQP